MGPDYFELSYTQVGDAGLANFQNCKQLVQLSAGGTAMTDAGRLTFL